MISRQIATTRSSVIGQSASGKTFRGESYGCSPAIQRVALPLHRERELAPIAPLLRARLHFRIREHLAPRLPMRTIESRMIPLFASSCARTRCAGADSRRSDLWCSADRAARRGSVRGVMSCEKWRAREASRAWRCPLRPRRRARSAERRRRIPPRARRRRRRRRSIRR